MSKRAVLKNASQEKPKVVVGLGKTGLSCVRFLKAKGFSVAVTDSRQNPPGLEELQQIFPDVLVITGNLDESMLLSADEIILSPGVAIQEYSLQAAMAQGVPVIGDIELFCRYTSTPIIAITGSNAKSTVTTLVGKMFADAGESVVVAGNIGIPVMDVLLEKRKASAYVLELSSFQLETTASLNAKVATILNISPDHLDRYDGIEDYTAAKQRIYQGCQCAVVNADDFVSQPQLAVPQIVSFSLGNASANVKLTGANITFDNCVIMPVSDMYLKGKHNQLNALAALAIGHSAGLSLASMANTLRIFQGLSHRCQWVKNISAVDWFNDSKGTNTGATIAAINSVADGIDGKVVLLAGGEGKGAVFSELNCAIKEHVKAVVLIGKDAALIEQSVQGNCPVVHADSLIDAVSSCHRLATEGDAVLLSPACASFDMFKNYEDRGDQFVAAVNCLSSEKMKKDC